MHQIICGKALPEKANLEPGGLPWQGEHGLCAGWGFALQRPQHPRADGVLEPGQGGNPPTHPGAGGHVRDSRNEGGSRGQRGGPGVLETSGVPGPDGCVCSGAGAPANTRLSCGITEMIDGL